ncbi:MAG: AAA family ATPase, partial [Candidatus Tectomicrobia bacterium]|nr:AAA family ATPase [Candidatus Tectomicrobia bacterium]
MICPTCQHENRAGAKFCEECGAKLAARCPHCGHEVNPQARFCDECGTPLVNVVPPLIPSHTVDTPVESQPIEPQTPQAERRQITAMFCDLVGSTPLSQQLDPEELRKVLQNYQALCAKVIGRFEGYLARYFGDGLLVYFGYPRAHEDDAQRAVRTGLGIVEAIGGLNQRLYGEMGIRLQVRVGIHTGLVVAGDMDTSQQLEARAIIGETPNIAMQSQNLAEPDTVVMSVATARLVEGLFECRPLGAQILKGISQPVELLQILHESTARSRLDAAALVGLTPLIGREREGGLLRERWEQAKEGMGQVVVLSGEAGIGKSRLVQAVKEWAAQDPHAWLTPCQCSPYHQNSAFYPMIDLLQRVVLQFEKDEPPQQKLRKLEGFLVQYGFSLSETVPLFADLLSIPAENYAPLKLSSEQQRQKTLHALLTLLLRRASQQPMLFVMEDLHWVDPSTLELLKLLVDQGPTTRILALFAFRPDFTLPWTSRSYLTHIVLTRLTRRQVVEMIDQVAGGKTLPAEVIEQVVSKTDGVPLFVEELTKMVLGSGLLREREDHYDLTRPLPPLAIPSTLHDSLMARLDRLAAVKGVAQLGATLGRVFSYELLQAVSPLDETMLRNALAQLVEAEFLYQQGLPPQISYVFKHALIQDAAYQSLLKSTRQQYHQRIAQVLVERFPETVETQPELLAHHYTEAGLREQAIACWQRAAQRAMERSANVEAIGHLTTALELLKTLPDTRERAQQELVLQTTLGSALMATKGYAAPEVEQAYARARALCQQVGETPHLFPVLAGLSGFYQNRAELQTARELREQLLHLAQHQQDPVLVVGAHVLLGVTLFLLGELASARMHLEQGIALYDPQHHRSLAFGGRGDPGVSGRSYITSVLWLLGYPDQALKMSHEALTMAQERSHPLSSALALTYTTILHQYRRESQLTQERAEATITLSTDQGFAQLLAMGTILRGWALTEHGQREEGIAQILEGFAAYRATGAELQQSYWLALLAEAYGNVGQVEEGLTLLTEVLAVVKKSSGRWWEAEIYRLEGELLLRVGERESKRVSHSPILPFFHSSPEACFLQALEIARRQQAKSLELRAATSLSRLWQQQGKREEA